VPLTILHKIDANFTFGPYIRSIARFMTSHLFLRKNSGMLELKMLKGGRGAQDNYRKPTRQGLGTPANYDGRTQHESIAAVRRSTIRNRPGRVATARNYLIEKTPVLVLSDHLNLGLIARNIIQRG
jgi:hypothetical protein